MDYDEVGKKIYQLNDYLVSYRLISQRFPYHPLFLLLFPLVQSSPLRGSPLRPLILIRVMLMYAD